jgi:hypothetical protein
MTQTGVYQSIKRKCEQAIESYLTQNKGARLSGVTMFKRWTSVTSKLSTPRIHIMVTNADPEILGTGVPGNWNVTARISMVSENSDTTQETHQDHCGAIEEMIMAEQQELLDEFNNLATPADFALFQWTPGASDDLANDTEMMTNYTVEMYCAPNNPSEEDE